MAASVALVNQWFVNVASLFVSVGVSLCKEEIGLQWGVSAGLVGTEGVGRFEVLFEVSLSPPLLSLLLRCGVGSPESRTCARTSAGKFIKLHLHS